MVERPSCCRRIQLFAFNNHETKMAWFSISRLTTTDNVYWLATLLKDVGYFFLQSERSGGRE